MKKSSLVLLISLLSLNVYAESFDLKVAMKQMGLEFKQAAKATSVEAMQVPIKRLTALVAESKKGEYPPEKREVYMEGFNKLDAALSDIQVHLSNQDLTKAQQALRLVDELRIEYHDKRNPSIWSRLFG